jgi:hypothetical protein
MHLQDVLAHLPEPTRKPTHTISSQGSALTVHASGEGVKEIKDASNVASNQQEAGVGATAPHSQPLSPLFVESCQRSLLHAGPLALFAISSLRHTLHFHLLRCRTFLAAHQHQLQVHLPLPAACRQGQLHASPSSLRVPHQHHTRQQWLLECPTRSPSSSNTSP